MTSSVLRDDRGTMSDWDVKFYPGRSTLHRKPLGEANYSPTKRQQQQQPQQQQQQQETQQQPSQRNINFNNANNQFNLYGTQV